MRAIPSPRLMINYNWDPIQLRQLTRFEMSNYNMIMTEFSKKGYGDQVKMGEYDVYALLDKICQQNTPLRQFNRELAQELWQNAERTPNNQVYLKDFARIMVFAQETLVKKIEENEGELNRPGGSADSRRESAQAVKQYTEQYRLLTEPFKIKPLSSSPLRDYPSGAPPASSGMESGIFDSAPSTNEESYTLKITLVIAIALFFFQFITMFQRPSMVNIMIYLAVLAIFFLNYFDGIHVKLCLVSLAVGFILDFLWVLLLANAFWNPIIQTQHSTLQTGFLEFIYILTVIGAFAKLVLIAILFRYRGNDASTKKIVKLLGLKFDLDGRCLSPFSVMLSRERAAG